MEKIKKINKWKIVAIGFIIYSVFATLTCIYLDTGGAKTKMEKKLSEVLDLSVMSFDGGDGEMVTGYSSSIGFFGDGDTYIEIALGSFNRENIETAIKNNGKWEKLPYPDVLEDTIYLSDLFENVEHDYEGLFPEMENGWYYFLDKQTQDVCSQVREDIWLRGSHNFIFAVYDSDNGRLYYYESDS